MRTRLVASGLALLVLPGAWVGAAPVSGGLHDPLTLDGRIERLQTTVEQRERQIEALQRQLRLADDLRPGTVRTEEIKRVVLELMADGVFREELYPDATILGYEEGFYVASTDEAFRLNVNGMMQARWTAANRQSDNRRLPGRNRQDDVNGFELQYVLLEFDGHLYRPELTYLISVIGDTDQDHGWETYYAWIAYEVAESLAISAGILDLPQGFNNLVADHKQLFVDRALAEEVFNVGPSVGVAASGLLFGRLEYAAGVFNGVNNPLDSPSSEALDTNFAYAALLIYHLMGDGVGDDETDLGFSKDPLWDVGLNFAYNDDNGDAEGTSFYAIPDRIRRGRGIGGYGEADLTGTDLLQFGGHTAFRYRGFSLTAEYYLRTIGSDDERSEWALLTGRSDSVHFQGGYVEAGYFIVPKTIELAARVGGVWDAGGDNTWEYTVGVNYYPYQSHCVKVQADFTRIEEAPLDSTLGNWFQNDDINMFRVAFQAAF